MNHSFGIWGQALELFRSYLSNRKQYTKILNYRSQLAEISHGVPQGLSLGSLLFALYINDLPHANQFDTTLFADDTYLILSDKSIRNLECKVNNELIKIEEWLNQNKLSLNCSKCCYKLINSHPSVSCNSDFQLSLNDFTLKRKETIKYLYRYLQCWCG